jgi:twitching motility two-component system response regulator PilG
MMLNQHGYQVTSIYHPLEDFPRLFKLDPDLILCDIAMPELDGYELCAMMRQTHVFRQTPIVMLTGKDGFIDRLKARMVGSDDFLSKPFGENELLMLVEQYIGPGHSNRQEPEPTAQDNQPQR